MIFKMRISLNTFEFAKYYHNIIAFCAIIEYGSFSGAAQRLGISQPAISKQVSDLEDFIGHKLILRNNRVLNLSPKGQLVFNKFKNKSN